MELLKNIYKLASSYMTAVTVAMLISVVTGCAAEGMVWTDAECEAYLLKELAAHEVSVSKSVTKTLRQCEFDALVSFSYNCGASALAASTLLKKVNANPSDQTIRAEFGKWVNAGGKPLDGLVKRRAAEANLYFS